MYSILVRNVYNLSLCVDYMDGNQGESNFRLRAIPFSYIILLVELDVALAAAAVAVVVYALERQ